MTATTYQVQGMTCGHCVSSVKTAVGALPGVIGVEVNLQAGSMTTTGTATTQAVSQAVADAGYAIVAAGQTVGVSLPMASGTGGCCCS
ncbi:heavy-metal-associated domain-containing protein [Rhodococcus sp. IEGM 1408]|uniref:heavy-metal-associated domain-containing protein n=1 Tax=Rhodococcus sp. IEGM 1408 TaxID=3082220 RepID=UPI0029555F2F|nr:cation transporter [Rhodococcus sp. IEGM 1408]MDV8003030.1 cation transporter [Rhodococcus sp. IEGM 1408]